jgi:hypothetical protein
MGSSDDGPPALPASPKNRARTRDVARRAASAPDSSSGWQLRFRFAAETGLPAFEESRRQRAVSALKWLVRWAGDPGRLVLPRDDRRRGISP